MHDSASDFIGNLFAPNGRDLTTDGVFCSCSRSAIPLINRSRREDKRKTGQVLRQGETDQGKGY